MTYEYVHVTGDSRTRREEEEEEEKEEEKSSTIATVLFVDCYRMPFSGHCCLIKCDLYTFDHVINKEQTCQMMPQDRTIFHVEIRKKDLWI